MIKLSTYDLPSYVTEVTLDGLAWSLRFDYNATSDMWTMAIADASLVWRLRGVTVVPNYPLLTGCHHLSIPRGEFIADLRDQYAQIDYEALAKSDATLYYLSEDEYAAL